MEAIKTRSRLQGHARAILRASAHRSEVQAEDRARRLRDGYYAIGRTGRRPDRRAILDHPEEPARDPRRSSPSARRPRPAAPTSRARPTARRPGIFYYNAYDLPSRRLWGMETLYLHEGSPGHHFQISLAQENEALPAFMRFGGNTAYVEGWALYAETLWDELGVESDPYQRFGGLNDEMLRAMRLVVDSGIHAKGWSREQAIDYMLANSGMSRTEVDRRGRALHRHPRPGARLQDRRPHHPAAQGQGARRRSAPVRPARIPRPGADDRIAADGGAREEDRRLDRGEQGLGPSIRRFDRLTG